MSAHPSKRWNTSSPFYLIWSWSHSFLWPSQLLAIWGKRRPEIVLAHFRFSLSVFTTDGAGRVCSWIGPTEKNQASLVVSAETISGEWTLILQQTRATCLIWGRQLRSEAISSQAQPQLMMHTLVSETNVYCFKPVHLQTVHCPAFVWHEKLMILPINLRNWEAASPFGLH